MVCAPGFFTVISAVVCLACVAAPAQAGTISGTFDASWGGVSTPGAEQPGGSAKWTFDFSLSSSDTSHMPATLAFAGQDPTTTECAQTPDNSSGTVTTYVKAVSDPAAAMNVVPYFNVRARAGTAIVRPSQKQSGFASFVTDRECAGAPDNGITSVPIPADRLVNQLITVDDWAIKQDPHTGVWTGGGTRKLPFEQAPDYAPQMQSMILKMKGSPASLNGMCLVPTAANLRFAHTPRQAKAYLASAGLPRPGMMSGPSRTVAAGHYFVVSQEVDKYRPCGAGSVILVRSTGRRFVGGSGAA